MKRMNESYGIGLHGQFIREKAGWGPTFTSFPEDAKKFSSPKAAQKYIQDNELEDMGVSVVSLPLADDLDESRLKRIVAESVKKVLKEGFDSEAELQRWRGQLSACGDKLMKLKHEVWTKSDGEANPLLDLAFDLYKLCRFAEENIIPAMKGGD